MDFGTILTIQSPIPPPHVLVTKEQAFRATPGKSSVSIQATSISGLPFKQPLFPQNQKEKRSLATTALSVPLAASPMLPIVFFLSAVRDPTPFQNQLSSPCSTIETLCAIPGDPYSDSNKSPINTWDKTVMDWNKKNKRAAKLARRKFLHRLHGSE